MLEKLRDQKLFFLQLLHKQNNNCFLQRLCTYRTQSTPFHQICRLPILDLVFVRTIRFSRKLLYLKQLSHNFKQCHFHEDWVSHLPRNKPTICRLPSISQYNHSLPKINLTLQMLHTRSYLLNFYLSPSLFSLSDISLPTHLECFPHIWNGKFWGK